jgi:hypothetical protein
MTPGRWWWGWRDAGHFESSLDSLNMEIKINKFWE